MLLPQATRDIVRFAHSDIVRFAHSDIVRFAHSDIARFAHSDIFALRQKRYSIRPPNCPQAISLGGTPNITAWQYNSPRANRVAKGKFSTCLLLAYPTGFEPATSRVGVLRAIQLCHG